MMNELKPCPFCGYNTPTLREMKSGGYILISCENCDIRFKLGAGAKERMKERVIETWNRRATDED